MHHQLRPEAYGEALSEVYDRMYPSFDTPQTVDFIAALLEPGARVVEFGAGTGRVAIPLAGKGFSVHAVEVSQPMLDKLHERDPEGTVKTVRADFAEHVIDGNFDLCYVVCNTLFMLPDPEQQIEGLRRAGEHLTDGGTLLVEVYDPSYFHQLVKPEFQVRNLASDQVMLDTISVDPVRQLLAQVHTTIKAGSVSTFTELSRYAWPSELDLMARVAGFEKIERHGDWERSPFVPGSHRHITRYRKSSADPRR
ncbi:Methyltransferase domain-containing protein [Amycolatopsis marina]|uniref:Methyltransferase domain-containing protein n=1 Tax=Amycolatopsis marina TaxID=490629 RepID=A0A1I1BC16_9PSEU|nr:class I SAM-dependent methyltransferase [Amycolatopsis marina]SFB47899.1 Methyltransferase domain-containing protein [Amycolatopsis marina]